MHHRRPCGSHDQLVLLDRMMPAGVNDVLLVVMLGVRGRCDHRGGGLRGRGVGVDAHAAGQAAAAAVAAAVAASAVAAVAAAACGPRLTRTAGKSWKIRRSLTHWK